MFKKTKVGVLLMGLAILCMLVPIESKAAVFDEYVSYARPSTSDTQGYLCLLLKDSSGQRIVRTFFWYCAAGKSGALSPCYMYLNITSDYVEFAPGGINSADTAWYHLSAIDEFDKLYSLKYSSTERLKLSFGAYVVDAFMYSGNVGQVNSSITNQSFTVYFNDNDERNVLMLMYGEIMANGDLAQDEVNRLQDIYNQQLADSEKLDALIDYLVEIKQLNDQTVENLYRIIEKETAIDNKLQELKIWCNRIWQSQRETNNWLEKIYNWLKDSPEQEKQEATTQGNSSVSSGTSNIDDKGADFGESLGGLVSSLSYSGTDCSWTFPQVKLPAIPGVMDEVVLIQEQPINFGEWINKIPSQVLLLIQSILTCALILYCFKELYSTISYALTLRGGGADE